MQAMILAAGRGERMRPLTDTLPKPLLCVGGKPLIVWHIERLASVGITDIVINHAWLGHKIEETLGNGQQFGVAIEYSAESPKGLETAGGIANALPLLGEQPFLVINGDIWCDWNPMQAVTIVDHLHNASTQAWLLMVDNPPHHPEGDFHLDAQGLLHGKIPTAINHTFAGIGVYHPSFFRGVKPQQPQPLAPLLRLAMQNRLVEGSLHAGQWIDVGTPERLALLDQQLQCNGNVPASFIQPQ
ncbi:N-acetylmuramate alpha-1-phosphate uridylyltransferase MurU [Advenella faeciporci]|uniref:N-acetylmuramate alpha-1-phosphate uridylyltransferase MurU n=1 Tax=Advenella faeciporci TaxID=797535 RepID=UPI001673B40B|nr:nucleotidyltransferase family protein [Advenella faeciporci]